MKNIKEFDLICNEVIALVNEEAQLTGLICFQELKSVV
jgi:hypothetical protein